MLPFNTNKLAAGRNEVEEIYEIADQLGVEIIKVNSKKVSMSLGSIMGFEVGKLGFAPAGGRPGVTVVKGYTYLYPDKNGTRWGFVIDTEHNRRLLASHLAAPVLDIADGRVKKELIQYCDENNINIKPQAATNPYAKKSIQEENLENKNAILESDMRIMERKLDAMREESEKQQREMLRKEQYRDSNTENTVTELQINHEGNAEEVEVEASTVALDKAPVKKPKESKGGKALSGKKVTKK